MGFFKHELPRDTIPWLSMVQAIFACLTCAKNVINIIKHKKKFKKKHKLYDWLKLCFLIGNKEKNNEKKN